MGPATKSIIAAATAALAGAGALLSACSVEPDAPRAARTERAVEAATLPLAAASPPLPPEQALPPRTRPDATGPRPQLQRLLAQATPPDTFRAYAVLAHCVHTRDFDRFVHALPADARSVALRARYGDGAARVAAACGDLSAQELDGRIALAAHAAEHGVAGAASAWIEEGPFGDPSALTQRPDDLIVVDWARQAIEHVRAAAKRSDIDAIGQFGLLCLNWELDDISRVRLLVEAGAEQRREQRISNLLE